MNKVILLITLLAFTAFSQTPKDINSARNEIKQNIISGTDGSIPVQQDFAKKNVGLAIIYSLILPGMGELYAGNYTTGKYFTIAEGALWGTFIGMNVYSKWKKNAYHSFAASNGGVNVAGKTDDYYATIGSYLDINEYNDDMARNGEFDKMYNTEQYYWKWSSTDRINYRAMWVSGEHATNNLRFVVGAMLINRLISSINAVRLVIAYNKNAPQTVGWNLTAGVSNDPTLPTSLIVNFQAAF
jgi:hypothetical protein